MFCAFHSRPPIVGGLNALARSAVVAGAESELVRTVKHFTHKLAFPSFSIHVHLCTICSPSFPIQSELTLVQMDYNSAKSNEVVVIIVNRMCTLYISCLNVPYTA